MIFYLGMLILYFIIGSGDVSFSEAALSGFYVLARWLSATVICLVAMSPMGVSVSIST